MLTDSQKIDAIVWKAKSEKLSYGTFSATITERKKQQIYEEYEEYWTEKQEAEKARLQKAKNKKNNEKVILKRNERF